jgi:diketogulonate reductase-like aldo/keto reductase
MSSSDLYSITARVPLNDGNSYPRFGLGVYVTEPGQETYQAVTDALEVRLLLGRGAYVG